MGRSDFFVGLNKEGIRIYSGEKKQEWKINYPDKTVDNLEILDIPVFGKWWAEVFEKLNLKRKSIVVVLQEPTLFYKKVGNETEADVFWKEVPLNPANLSKILIKQKQDFIAVAVNRQLYEAVMSTAKENSSTINGIYPEFMFPNLQPEEIIKISDVVKEANFLNLHLSEKDLADEKLKTGTKVRLMIEVIMIFILGGNLAVSFVGKKEPMAKSVNPTPVTINLPTVTVIPGISISPVADFSGRKILVLNASGKPGKAKEIADYLAGLGYTDVATGNIKDSSLSGLLVKVNTNTALGKKLFSDLSGSYNPASPESGWTENADTEAVVIIGK